MRIAVAQHLVRTHERMDLAALLSLAERGAEEGVGVMAFPCVPGLDAGGVLMSAFAANVAERAPDVAFVAPCAGRRRPDPLAASLTKMGRTLVLAGDDCMDPDLFPAIEALGLEALVWQVDTESPLQAEAVLELALDASLSLAGLVLVATIDGTARGVTSCGGGAIVHLGEILAEADSGEDLLVAEVPVPVPQPTRRGARAVPAPVLLQRLSVHRQA